MTTPAVRELDFAIIGAQKSASTFVQRALIDHPEVGMPPGESHIIEDPWYSEEVFESHIATLAKRCSGKRLLGIKRPDCLGLEASTERLRHHMPDGKILVTLRNPIDRALSGYFHFLRYDILPMLDLETGMDRILRGDDCAHHRSAHHGAGGLRACLAHRDPVQGSPGPHGGGHLRSDHLPWAWRPERGRPSG